MCIAHSERACALAWAMLVDRDAQMEHVERPLRSVLVAVDGGPCSERVTDRAALLPLASDAGVTLLHVTPKLRSRRSRRSLESNARAVLHACAKRVARNVPRISSIVTAGFARSEIVEHARAVDAEILVMGSGSITGRVIRHVKRPVLVVRRPAREYRRPLLALDVDDTAADVLRFLPRLLGTRPLPVAFVHVDEAPRESWLSRAAFAGDRLARLIARFPGEIRGPRHVRRGSSRSVIAETAAHLACDLLVMGTHARSGLAHACLGSVALDVLREVSCDVLIVPAAQVCRLQPRATCDRHSC